MLLYINFCFYFDTRNLSSNDIIYLTRVSLPLTSSRRGWSRYIDIQRLVNIFSDRNSSTGCFVTLWFPFFFFYWPRYVPEIGVPFIEGKIKDILCGWGKKFRVNSLIESPFLLLRWKKKSTRILLTIYWPNFLYRLSTNSSAIPVIVN